MTRNSPLSATFPIMLQYTTFCLVCKNLLQWSPKLTFIASRKQGQLNIDGVCMSGCPSPVPDVHKCKKEPPTNHRFTAIIQVNLRQPAPPVKNWRILLVQSFTASMPLLTATSTFGLGRRRWSSPQQCYLYCLRTCRKEAISKDTA